MTYLIGPGEALHAQLEAYGIKDDGECHCAAHARTMDLWGPEGCTERIDEIVGWLEAEAKRRGMWFVGLLAKELVKQAIRRSRQSLLTASKVTEETPPWQIEPLLDELTPTQREWPNSREAIGQRDHKQRMKNSRKHG